MSNEQNVFGSAYRAKSKKPRRSRKSVDDAKDAKDELQPEPAVPQNDDKSVSYRIGSQLQKRVKEKAVSERVGQADLVRFLLVHGLNALDSGALILPVEEPQPKRLKIKAQQ